MFPQSLSPKKRLNPEKSYSDILKTYQIDFIVLAGFMSKIADNLLAAYPHKKINIQPALLPKFGEKGCTACMFIGP
jgi:phosphoribosylglycinamide formyltransferase-1